MPFNIRPWFRFCLCSLVRSFSDFFKDSFSLGLIIIIYLILTFAIFNFFIFFYLTVSNAVPFPDLRNQNTRLDFLTAQEFEASTAVLKPLNDQLPTQEAMDYFQATADQLAAHINEIDMSFLYVTFRFFFLFTFVIPNFFFFFHSPEL
jgi:hypothetical protein